MQNEPCDRQGLRGCPAARRSDHRLSGLGVAGETSPGRCLVPSLSSLLCLAAAVVFALAASASAQRVDDSQAGPDTNGGRVIAASAMELHDLRVPFTPLSDGIDFLELERRAGAFLAPLDSAVEHWRGVLAPLESWAVEFLEGMASIPPQVHGSENFVFLSLCRTDIGLAIHVAEALRKQRLHTVMYVDSGERIVHGAYAMGQMFALAETRLCVAGKHATESSGVRLEHLLAALLRQPRLMRPLSDVEKKLILREILEQSRVVGGTGGNNPRARMEIVLREILGEARNKRSPRRALRR